MARMDTRVARVPLLFILAVGTATAQTDPPGVVVDAFPVRTVRIVAAQQPGSANDNVARILADALAEAWGQPTVVENRPGASGAIGTKFAAQSAPDGYTLLVGGMSNTLSSPVLDPRYGIDAARDFVAIGRIAWVPFVLAVHPDVPAHTMTALVEQARRHPRGLVFATSGPTAFSRLCVEHFARRAGVEFLTVEYRGAPAATLDLVAGRAQLQINEVAAMKLHADAGRVRLLAVAGDRRTAKVPALPTFAEAGMSAIPLTPWYGLFAPAGIAPPILARVEAAYLAAMRSPELRARLEALGYEPIVDEPGEFPRAFRADLEAIRALARGAGLLPP